MAIVTTAKFNETLYIVEVEMSAPSKVDRSEVDHDENSKKMYYHFSEEVRKEIQALRERVNHARTNGCAKFYGKLFVTNDIGKDQLTTLVDEVDRGMRVIDPTLKAVVHFVPMPKSYVNTGSVMDTLVTSIRTQIHETVLERVRATIEKNGETILPMKTKNALLRMLERVKGVNIINDPLINQRIEDMKAQIEKDSILPLRDEILAMMKEDKDRFSSIDFDDDTSVPAQATTAVDEQSVTAEELPDSGTHDADEQEYQAIPVTSTTGTNIAHRITAVDLDD